MERTEKAIKRKLVRLKSGDDNDPQDDLVFDEIDDDIRPKKYREEVEEDEPEPPLSKWKLALIIIQRSIFLILWAIFTYYMLKFDVDDMKNQLISIPINESKYIELDNYNGNTQLGLILNGPFMHDYGPKSKPMPQITVKVIDKINASNENDVSSEWTITLNDDLDHSEIVIEEHVFDLENVPNDESLMICLKSNLNKHVVIRSKIVYSPLNKNKGVIVGTLVLIFLYALIVFEIINRTIASMMASTLALGCLSALGMRPSIQMVVSWIDVETTLLLFSMMILVGILSESGLFDYMTVFAYKITKGRIWPLINTLCFITAAFSTFMDSVTMMLLVTPVTIRLCEIVGLNPVPVLMCMVFYSNVGAAMTPVGDPPNVIITTNHYIAQQGMDFPTFLTHMLPAVLMAIVQTHLQLRFIYRNINDLKFQKPLPEEELLREIEAWKYVANTIEAISKDENIVQASFMKKISRLKKKLAKGLWSAPAETSQDFDNILEELRNTYYIRDKVLLIKSLIAFGMAAVLFCLHSVPAFHNVSMGWAALISAILLMVIADIKHLSALFRRVEWSTLLFFASLFILMEALSKMGVIEVIGDFVKYLILLVNEDNRLIFAMLIILWVSAIASAFLDNIPVSTMMVKIVIQLAQNRDLNLPLHPLCWALALGACYGGNGTLIGASANVVAAGVAEQHGHKFSFIGFFVVGFPVMLGNTIMASIYLIIAHCVFQWHTLENVMT